VKPRRTGGSQLRSVKPRRNRVVGASVATFYLEACEISAANLILRSLVEAFNCRCVAAEAPTTPALVIG